MSWIGTNPTLRRSKIAASARRWRPGTSSTTAWGYRSKTYPLFENALRGRAGRGAAEHRLALGRLFAPFTRVAAENPYAFYGVERSAEQLAAVTAENRLISDTYPNG